MFFSFKSTPKTYISFIEGSKQCTRSYLHRQRYEVEKKHKAKKLLLGLLSRYRGKNSADSSPNSRPALGFLQDAFH